MGRSANGRIQNKAWTRKTDYRKIGPFGARGASPRGNSDNKINRAADGN